MPTPGRPPGRFAAPSGTRPDPLAAEVLRVLDALGDHAIRQEHARMVEVLVDLRERTRPGSGAYQIAAAALAPPGHREPASPEAEPAGVGLSATVLVFDGGHRILMASRRHGDMTPEERAAMEIFELWVPPTPGLQAARLEHIARLIPTQVKGAGGVAELADALRGKAVFS